MKKHKVRIKKLPGSQGLPENVGYAGAVYPVFAYGGYLPRHQTQGVVGGINTPHDKSIIGSLTGNLGPQIDIQAQDNISWNQPGTDMPVNPYAPVDPYMTNIEVDKSAIDEQEETRKAKESGEYTVDYGSAYNIDTKAGIESVNRRANQLSNFLEGRQQKAVNEANMLGNWDSNKLGVSDTMDMGDYQTNTGDLRPGSTGPKHHGRYVPRTQRGGYLPKAQKGTFDEEGNEWVDVTGYYSGAENPAAADI